MQQRQMKWYHPKLKIKSPMKITLSIDGASLGVSVSQFSSASSELSLTFACPRDFSFKATKKSSHWFRHVFAQTGIRRLANESIFT